MILFINACVRKESRTKRLADALLSKLGGEIEEVRLWETEMPVVDEAFLDTRNAVIEREDFEDPVCDLARQFARADIIVIGAPYWDLSFPASLKQYFELINVLGVTFKYTDEGTPVGLCRAEKLYYVTTAGGYILSDDFGFGYVKALANTFYGIEDVRQIKAEGLDIVGADVEKILKNVEIEL